MKNKQVSIIVPVYNNEKYIEKCISSIRNQTYKNIQIIVINDGSTDDSLNILVEIAAIDDRVKIINQSNSGISFTRNVGISNADGEYIAFVDSDDWLDEDVIEKSVQLIEKHEADIVLWPYIREYANKSLEAYLFEEQFKVWDNENICCLHRRLVGLYGEELKQPHKLDSLSPVWGKLYKKKLIENINFVDLKEIGTAEDALFNIQLFTNINKAVYFSSSFYHYRKDNDSSITYNYKKNLVYKWGNLFSKIKDHLVKTYVSEDFYVALNNRICLGLIGLGMKIVEDTNMSYLDKKSELIRILNLEQYRDSLKTFQNKGLSVVWRFLFFMLKNNLVDASLFVFYFLSKIKKYIR